MGNRFGRFSEENYLPPQIGFQGPDTASQIARMSEEAYSRGQDFNQQQQQSADKVNAFKQQGTESLAQGISQGVRGGVDSYEKARDRQMRQEELQRQNMLAEEQRAASKQAREIAEERRAPELQNLGTQGKVLESQAKASEVAAKSAESEAAALDAPSTNPKYAGKTNREAQITADVETKLMAPEIAKGQLANETQRIALQKQQLAQEAKMFPLKTKEITAQIAALDAQQKNAQFAYEESVRQKNVRQYAALLGSETDSAKRGLVAGQMKAQGANPYEVAEAMATSKTNDFNRKVLEQTTDPLFAKKTEAHYEAITTRTALTDMGNALKEYRETGFWPSAKSDDSLRKFQSALRSVGRDKEADSLSNFIAIDGGDLRIGREKEMLAILKNIQDGTARTIRSQSESMKDPALAALADQVSASNQDLVPLTGLQKFEQKVAGQQQSAPVAQGAPAPQGPPSLVGNRSFKPLSKPSKVGAK